LLIVSAASAAVAAAPVTDIASPATPVTVPVHSAADVAGMFRTCCAFGEDV